MSRQAYVTLVASDSYATGAVVLAHSLRMTGATREISVMVTSNVGAEARAEVRTFSLFHVC